MIRSGLNIYKKVITYLITFFVSLFFVVSATFFLFEAVPGDLYDLDYIKNENVINNIRNKYHLNDSLPNRYLSTIKNFAAFDFGYSMINDGRAVNDIIKEKFPISAVIGIFSIILSLIFGIILGLLKSKILSNKRWVIFTIEILLISIPTFVLSVLLQYIFCVVIKLFPVYWDYSILGYFLPIVVLSIYPTIFISRMLESNIKKLKESNYVIAAISRGISNRKIMFIYMLKNSLTPILSYIAPLIANFVVGSFVVESIFNIPGLGRYFISSIINRDYPVAMGLTVFFSSILIITTTLFNILISIIDYRGNVMDKKNEI